MFYATELDKSAVVYETPYTYSIVERPGGAGFTGEGSDIPGGSGSKPSECGQCDWRGRHSLDLRDW